MEVLTEAGMLKKKVKQKEICLNECLNLFRSDTVKAMRDDRSNCVVLNLDDQKIDFINKFKNDAIFPSEKIFDFATWRKEYPSFIRDEEKVDFRGKKLKEFNFDRKFLVVVLCEADTEEELLRNVSYIPHIDKFHRVVI